MQHHGIHNVRVQAIRGDHFDLWVGLARGWEEQNAVPHLYEGRMALRETQDDLLPDLMPMVSELLPGDDPRFPGMERLLHFAATPEETQALPDWQLVCYCELRSLDGSYVRRLFDGKVTVHD